MTIYRKQGRRYVTAPELECVDAFDIDELLVGAFRYYCGRMTIVSCVFAERLAAAWPTLPQHSRIIIRRDLSEEFERDNESRKTGKSHHPLGQDCDRKAWEKVRAAWMAMESKEAP